ncbi:hypothetical protein PS1_016903 [Malus domestica]
MNSHIAVTLLSVLACIFLSVDSAFTPSNVTDKEALISFQSTANLPPFFWNQSSSPCTNWTGVACNRIGGTQRVVSLDLSGFGLTGSISHHVGSLTESFKS